MNDYILWRLFSNVVIEIDDLPYQSSEYDQYYWMQNFYWIISSPLCIYNTNLLRNHIESVCMWQIDEFRIVYGLTEDIQCAGGTNYDTRYYISAYCNRPRTYFIQKIFIIHVRFFNEQLSWICPTLY